MKKSSAVVLFTLFVVVAWVLLPTVHADSVGLEVMKAQIAKSFLFGGITLPPGEYQFLHDDAKKAAGEPCLSIWKATGPWESSRPQKLAASYCDRVPRELNPDGYLELENRGAGRYEVTEIQFPGSDFAHLPRADVAR